jgi:FAD:protein FMN transferase
MGLPVSVLARGTTAHSAQAEAAVQAVYADLVQVDAVFSPYRPDSVVSKLAGGELELSDCDAQVQDVAARCRRARDLTGGLFDATRPDGRWDPSGLVKGWAVERAARHLAAVSDLDWCLNAGGDVVVVCPSGIPFTVGIQDPRDPARVAAVVPCRAGGVATSGTAARGEHLYDPRSGAAAVASASVTVVGPSLQTADVLATAAFVAGEDALELITATAGYEGLRIDLGGRLTATMGWDGTAVGSGADSSVEG